MRPPTPRRRFTHATIAFYRDVAVHGMPGSVESVANGLRRAIASAFELAPDAIVDGDRLDWYDAPIGFHHGYPFAAAANLAPHRVRVLSTQREGRCPAKWAAALRGLDLVVVPSEWSKGLLREVYEGPILVVHHGIDPAFVPGPARRDDGTFRVWTSHSQQSDPWRKGEDLVVRAFARAFAGDPSVRLVVNTQRSNELRRLLVQHGIEAQAEFVEEWRQAPAQIAALIRGCDVGLFLPRAEGFGLLPLEAAACGLPLVAPRSTGLAEYLPFVAAEEVPTCAVHVNRKPWHDGGELPEPDVEAAAVALRRVRNFLPLGARENARAAAPALRWFTWENTSVPLIEELRGLARLPRVHAHRPQLRVAYVSTVDESKCGIASYTANLACALSGCEVRTFGDGREWNRTDTKSYAAALPLLVAEWGADVVHVQHEFGIFRDDGAFAAMLRAFAALDLPCAVTLHTTFAPGGPYAWLFRRGLRWADAVVVHGEDAAEALRTWPVRPAVSVIPHGTPLVQRGKREEARASLELPLSSVVALSLGFVTPDKALGEVVDAVLDLRDEGRLPPGFVYVVAGGGHPAAGAPMGEELARLAAKVKERNGEALVQLRPGFADAGLWYSAADFAIFNRRSGLACLSASGAAHLALGYGVPAVWRDCPLHQTLAGTGFPFRTRDELAERIYEAIARMDDSILPAVAARRDATLWPAVAAMHADLYRRIV